MRDRDFMPEILESRRLSRRPITAMRNFALAILFKMFFAVPRGWGQITNVANDQAVRRRGEMFQAKAWLAAVVASLLIGFTTLPLSAQSFAPQSDSQAVALASRSILAMTGSNVIKDVSLTGTLSETEGNSDGGTISLKALGTLESRIELELPSGTRTEIRDASAGYAQGKWTNPDGSTGMFANQNLMTDAVWFFPAFTTLAGDPNATLTYMGLESLDNHSVQHLRSVIANTGSSPDPATQQLSTMDFYLDSATLLPYAIIFNQHPDNNLLVNIPIKIVFSNYQLSAGVLVPMHIERFMNGAEILNINLSDVQFNTGLTIADFAIAGGAQ
jgi:hypothetical protein